MTTTSQFCTFYVGDLYLGIEVEQIQEVNRHQEITRVPLAPDVVSGLINLRGQIVTAIDLRRRIGLEESCPNAERVNVVVRGAGETASLLVDEIGDVIEVSAEQHESPPATMPPRTRELVNGVYKLNGQLMLALDTAGAMGMRSSQK